MRCAALICWWGKNKRSAVADLRSCKVQYCLWRRRRRWGWRGSGRSRRSRRSSRGSRRGRSRWCSWSYWCGRRRRRGSRLRCSRLWRCFCCFRRCRSWCRCRRSCRGRRWSRRFRWGRYGGGRSWGGVDIDVPATAIVHKYDNDKHKYCGDDNADGRISVHCGSFRSIWLQPLAVVTFSTLRSSNLPSAQILQTICSNGEVLPIVRFYWCQSPAPPSVAIRAASRQAFGD